MTRPYCTTTLFSSSKIGWLSISYGGRSRVVFLIELHLWHGKPPSLVLLLHFIDKLVIYLYWKCAVYNIESSAFHLLLMLKNYLMLFFSSSLTFTSGNWDIKTQVPHQCSVSSIKLPDYFMEWINIKDVYLNFYQKKVQYTFLLAS